MNFISRYMSESINIITFNNPYPPDYGGVIDVFYKMKALHALGVKIHLHSFAYGREPDPALAAICASVHYYRRDKMWKGFLTDKPFIVQTRNAPALIKELLQNDHPILFEGLHCCNYLSDDRLRHRKKMVRMHNNEPEYYLHLAKREKKLFTKLYFYEEYRRLIRYENVLQYADQIYCISRAETENYKKRFPSTEYLAPFHENESVTSLPGKGDYILYHGNLSVNENEEAALWLTEKVFPYISARCIIAGNSPSAKLKQLASQSANIEVVADPSHSTMQELIARAHINMLPAFQSTGIKLKLINALFQGRFCMVNEIMVKGTGLEDYCLVKNTPEEMVNAVQQTMERPFTDEMIASRKIMASGFSNRAEAEKILKWL